MESFDEGLLLSTYEILDLVIIKSPWASIYSVFKTYTHKIKVDRAGAI